MINGNCKRVIRESLYVMSEVLTNMMSYIITHEKLKRLGSIEYIGTQTFTKRLDHYINRPKRLHFWWACFTYSYQASYADIT